MLDTSINEVGVQLSDQALPGLVQLAGWDSFENHALAALNPLKCPELPAVNRAKTFEGVTLLRLALDRVWVIGDAAKALVSQDMDQSKVVRLDLTHSRRLFTLTGPGACDCLMRWCAVDLRPRSFATDQLAQTGIHGIGIQIFMEQAGVYHVLVPITYARALENLLLPENILAT